MKIATITLSNTWKLDKWMRALRRADRLLNPAARNGLSRCPYCGVDICGETQRANIARSACAARQQKES